MSRDLLAVHRRIEELDERLDNLVDQITSAALVAAETEALFKSKFAQERLTVRIKHSGEKITVDQVEDYATIATSEERSAHLIAASTLTSLREALRACIAQMDGARSEAASYRGAGG